MTGNEKKNKHMTLEDRIEIQECLYKRMTFKAIAKRVGKDPTTISKEVKLHAQIHKNSFTLSEQTCPKLLKAPFVCNGCEKHGRRNCTFPRRLYSAKKAQEEYETDLHESRTGIALNKEEFYSNDQLLYDAIRAGQHVYHAIHSNKLTVSKSTVYRYIQRGYSSISKLDLPRAVKFKPRARKNEAYVPKGVRINRTYTDYLAYKEAHIVVNPVEMDTVIGSIGGKVIMTFQFTNVDFMFGILLDNKTAAEAAQKIRLFKQRLSCLGYSFGKLFPVLLTDNGGEFSDVFAFENDPSGQRETLVFFCDPNASYQKPHVEHNHSLFRSIVPKGTSFNSFTQDTVNLIFSHVNGVLRNQFNGKSAYDMFTFAYSAELARALGISFVPPKDVCQCPALIKNIVSD